VYAGRQDAGTCDHYTVERFVNKIVESNNPFPA